MKSKLLLTLLVFLILFSVACSLQDDVEELPTGKYVMKDAPTEDWAWVLLEEDNRFEFNPSMILSYRPTGTYSVEEDELLLKVSDTEIYRFEIKENTLIFKGTDYAGNFLENDSVFELVDNEE